MSPQGHRPGPDSRTLPGPAVSRRLRSPRPQSRDRHPRREAPQPPASRETGVLGGLGKLGILGGVGVMGIMGRMGIHPPLIPSHRHPFLSQSSHYSQDSHNSQPSHHPRLRVTAKSDDGGAGRIEGGEEKLRLVGKIKAIPLGLQNQLGWLSYIII